MIEMKMTRVNYKDTLNKILTSRTQRYSLPTIDAIYPQVLFVLKKQIMIITKDAGKHLTSSLEK